MAAGIPVRCGCGGGGRRLLVPHTGLPTPLVLHDRVHQKHQIGPPFCDLMRRLGPRAVAVRVCVWGNCPVRGWGTGRVQYQRIPQRIFRGKIHCVNEIREPERVCYTRGWRPEGRQI